MIVTAFISLIIGALLLVPGIIITIATGGGSPLAVFILIFGAILFIIGAVFLIYGEKTLHPKKKKPQNKTVGIIGAIVAGIAIIICAAILIASLSKGTTPKQWFIDQLSPNAESTWVSDLLKGAVKLFIPGGLGDNSPTGSDPVSHDKENKSDANIEMTDDIYNFLIVGHDRAANLCDVSMLVSFNVYECTLNVMQLPRDTYVNYDGYWYHKLNGVYSYYLTGEQQDPKYYGEEYSDKTQEEILYEQEYRAIEEYASFIEKNLCTEIDYFGIMDLDQFVNIVDALGGVDMYVPFAMSYYDPTANFTINLHEGQQTLDGTMAEQFVRYRATFSQGDIGRGNMQKLFMAALFKTVQKKLNLFNLNNVCSIIVDNLVTNLKTTDLIYFAGKANTVRLEYVTMMTLPGGAFSGDDGLSYYSINREAVLNYINDYFNFKEEPVSDEEFDPDGVFFNYSYIYSASADSLQSEIYDAGSLTDGTQKPST